MNELTYITTISHIFPELPSLVQVKMPAQTGKATVRSLWVPTEIEAVLCGVLPTSEYPNPKLSALVQRYIAGYYVTASLCGNPNKKNKPDFEKLTGLDEAWAMCFRDTKVNQWRLLGRFIEKNVYVGLGLYRRSILNGQKTYHSKAVEFLDRWDRIRPFQSVVRSNSVEDYISEPVRDVYANSLI